MEAHNWGKSVAFWCDLGYDLEHSLLLRHPAGGPFIYLDDPTEHVAWIKQFWTRLEPFTQGFYVNDGDPDTYLNVASVHANYRENYDRLVEIKNRYDPNNLFRLNANVQPTV